MKKYKQIAPLCILIAFIVSIFGIYLIIKEPIEELNNAKITSSDAKQNLERLQLEDKQIRAQQEKDELELRSIKPIFQAPENSGEDNLSAFGMMFDKIIGIAKANGLLLRSLEYKMNPDTDTVYMSNPDAYNVCELKFFFVGTYNQLKNFLVAITNNFEYLVSISNLSVTSFSSNPDYVLINLSLTLYSKKPTKAGK